MKKYEYERVPSTLEEIGTSRRKKRMLLGMVIPSVIFYVFVFIFVPKIPDNPFYLELDKFMDSYLFGYVMPKYSSNFYFTMKVAWCFSFLYAVFAFFLSLVLFHFYMKPDGVRIVAYISRYSDSSTKNKIFMTLVTIIALILFLNIAMWPYAFVIGRGGHGDFSWAVFRFFLFTPITGSGVMQTLALKFYFSFILKGD